MNQAFARKFLNGARIRSAHVAIGAGGRAWSRRARSSAWSADAVYRRVARAGAADDVRPARAVDDSGRRRRRRFSVSVRATAGSPAAAGAQRRCRALAGVDPDLALTFRPLADQVNASLTQERVVAMLSGFFGALALLLAGLGLYGVTSYAVNRRRTEIGVRMALGAAPAGVVRLVSARVSLLVGLGVVGRRRPQPLGVAVRRDAALRSRASRSGDAGRVVRTLPWSARSPAGCRRVARLGLTRRKCSGIRNVDIFWTPEYSARP